MAYVALYRTYRPKTFKEVAGQEHITRTLMNSLASGKICHAYLFSGPRGTGKTSIAKIFAKAVNCMHAPVDDPCNECEICQGINKGTIGDVIEIDAASNNGVDEIREIRDKVKYVPSVCKYKVYIIDEVHMLSTSAFNALLKTLEEPPKHAIFILATTEVHKIPATILSRCQRFDFRAISNDEIINRIKEVAMKENLEITDEAVEIIANNAEGGLRDALSLLDQAISYSNGKIDADSVHKISGSVALEKLIDIVYSISIKDAAKGMMVLDELIKEGKENTRIVLDLITFFRDVLIYKNVKNRELSIFKNEKFISIADALTNQRIYMYLNILNEVQNNIKWTNQKRAYLDMGIIKMCDADVIKPVEENELLYNLEKRIKDLESRKVVVKEEKKVIKKPTSNNKIKTIESILNNPNKDKRMLMQKGWSSLGQMADPTIKVATRLLSESELVAMNEFDMLITFDDEYKCEQIEREENKQVILRVLNRKNHLIDNYVAITKDQWNILLGEYKKQKALGVANPSLKEANINLENKIEATKTDFEKVTLDFFGEEKTIFEE